MGRRRLWVRAAMPRSRSPAPGPRDSASTPPPVRSRPLRPCRRAATRSPIGCATGTPRPTAPPPPTASGSQPASWRYSERHGRFGRRLDADRQCGPQRPGQRCGRDTRAGGDATVAAAGCLARRTHPQHDHRSHVTTTATCRRATYSSPTSCATATRPSTAPPPPIGEGERQRHPGPLKGSAVAGVASTPISNVAAGATVNGVAATLGPSGNATVAALGIWPAGISLNPTTGAVSTSAALAPRPMRCAISCATAIPRPACHFDGHHHRRGRSRRHAHAQQDRQQGAGQDGRQRAVRAAGAQLG